MAQGQFTVPLGFRTAALSFNSTASTVAEVLVDQQASGVTIGGSTTAGGCRVTDIIATNSDSQANYLALVEGQLLTTQGQTVSPLYGTANTTGAITATSTTLTRATGDWRIDGFRVGQRVMVFAPRNGVANASDGVSGVITTLTATVLTCSAGPFASETLLNSSQIFRVGRRSVTTVAIGAGYTSTNSSVRVLGDVAQDQSNDLNGISLGPNEVLIASLNAAAGSTTVTLDVIAKYGLL